MLVRVDKNVCIDRVFMLVQRYRSHPNCRSCGFFSQSGQVIQGMSTSSSESSSTTSVAFRSPPLINHHFLARQPRALRIGVVCVYIPQQQTSLSHASKPVKNDEVGRLVGDCFERDSSRLDGAFTWLFVACMEYWAAWKD